MKVFYTCPPMLLEVVPHSPKIFHGGALLETDTDPQNQICLAHIVLHQVEDFIIGYTLT